MAAQPVRISFIDLGYDDGIYHIDGIPYTGIAFREMNGVIKEEQEYKNGLASGRAVVWRESGAVRLDASYHRGVLHGAKTTWAEDGKMELEELYELGVLLLRRRRNAAGEMVEEFRLDPSQAGFRTLMTLRRMYPDAKLRFERHDLFL